MNIYTAADVGLESRASYTFRSIYRIHTGAGIQTFLNPSISTFRPIYGFPPQWSDSRQLPAPVAMKFSPVLSYSLLLGGILYISLGPTLRKHQPDAAAMAERGKYLVGLGGCADCHTPKIMTERGLVSDESRAFAGHPEGLDLPLPGESGGPWSAATAGMTAWSGPWGISYASNLTPDPATGLWSEDVFISAMRTGKHRGFGRPILPPMPWETLSKATDEDLKAIYAYLRTLPPVFNQVPDPRPAVEAQTAGR
jgi:mono/diheme cytochrome c family protein